MKGERMRRGKAWEGEKDEKDEQEKIGLDRECMRNGWWGEKTEKGLEGFNVRGSKDDK